MAENSAQGKKSSINGDIRENIVDFMLYKQIIVTRSIPFALTVPNIPIARDEMDTAAFDAMMNEGLAQAKAGQGLSLDKAFSLLRGDMHG